MNNFSIKVFLKLFNFKKPISGSKSGSDPVRVLSCCCGAADLKACVGPTGWPGEDAEIP